MPEGEVRKSFEITERTRNSNPTNSRNNQHRTLNSKCCRNSNRGMFEVRCWLSDAGFCFRSRLELPEFEIKRITYWNQDRCRQNPGGHIHDVMISAIDRRQTQQNHHHKMHVADATEVTVGKIKRG